MRSRGKSLFENRFKAMTSVDFKSLMLADGRRAPLDRVCLPTRVAAEEAPEPEAAAEGADPEASADFAAAFGSNGSDEILMASKLCLGWQCSYRSVAPERRSFDAWRSRWSKARARYSNVPLLPPRIRRAQSEQLALQDVWRKRRHVSRVAA